MMRLVMALLALTFLSGCGLSTRQARNLADGLAGIEAAQPRVATDAVATAALAGAHDRRCCAAKCGTGRRAVSHRQDRGQRRKAEKIRKARSLAKKRDRLNHRGRPAEELMERLHQMVASRQARIALATIDEASPSICAMWEEYGIDMHAVAPAEEGRAQLRERAIRHVSAEEWDSFFNTHRQKCQSIPPGAAIVSFIGWKKDGELLADPREFDPSDNWEVLRSGQHAGQISSANRTVSLTGGALYRVELANPSYSPDDEGGPDAPHGFTGILVAMSQRAGMVALDAASDVRLANGSEIVAIEPQFNAQTFHHHDP